MYFGGARKKRDASEPAIIEALKAVGCKVWQLNGSGIPDLLVKRRGKLFALECKSGKAKLRDSQSDEFPIVRSAEEALVAINAVATSTRLTEKPNQTAKTKGIPTPD